MKFVHPNTGNAGKQFSHIRIERASKLMIGELLHIINGDYSPSAAVYAEGMEAENWCICMTSGAKLYYNRTQKNFHIYCYHYAGKDGVAAMEQLKMANSIRLARKHLANMHIAMSTHKPPRMRVLYEHGYGNSAAAI